MTDKYGRINAEPKDYPLSVRCLGYEAVTSADINDNIFLTPARYPLSEVVVSPKDRPVTRVVTYAREYCTGSTRTDTMQLYCEYMLEYFFADGKVKGYSKTDMSSNKLAVRRYGRIANSRGLDSIMRPRYDDGITDISFLSNMAFVPYELMEETEAMKNGAVADTVLGKYFPKFMYRKTNDNFIVDCDALSAYKNHKCSPWFFKLLGMTMEIQQAEWSLLYNKNDIGKYGIYDFIYGTYRIHVLAKGKQIRNLIGLKDAIGIDCYIEQYPIEIQRLSTEEYKELKRDYFTRKEEFRLPENVLPPIPAIENLVGRVDAEIPLKANSRY